MAEQSPPEPLDLNQIVSLSQEKQVISLLKWLAACESFLVNSSAEQVTTHQQTFQQAFLNLLSLPTPPLAHVLRTCLGRCFSEIFERGDRRVLFDTVSSLLQKVNQFKADKEAKQKQYDPCVFLPTALIHTSATLYCLGAVLAVASDSIIQLLSEIVSGVIKVIRTSQFDVGLRAIAYDTLGKAFIKQIRIDESVIKDLNKVVRLGFADKSLIIQLRAIQVLSEL
jgi:hypothetical protein